MSQMSKPRPMRGPVSQLALRRRKEMLNGDHRRFAIGKLFAPCKAKNMPVDGRKPGAGRAWQVFSCCVLRAIGSAQAQFAPVSACTKLSVISIGDLRFFQRRS